MPSLLIEDISPFLNYSMGQWWLGQDNLVKSSGGTITATNVTGATVSFKFYGTGVEIFGSKRPEFGTYRVTLDNGPPDIRDGGATSDIWHQSLFKATNLPKGDHIVTFEHAGGRRRDLDYITWEQSIGNDEEPVLVHTIQDVNSAFVYSPPERWTTSAPAVQSYSGGTGHATNHITATARLRFRGDAIALYGPVGNEAADAFSVKVDGRPAERLSASTFDLERLRAQQLLYFGSNLGPGEHEIVISLDSISSIQQYLAIDYAQIFTTPSLGGDLPLIAPGNTSCPSPVASASSFESSPPIGLIAAVAILGALSMICLCLLGWIFALVKKGRLRRYSDPNLHPPSRPDPTLLSSILHSSGQSPNPGVIPVPFHVGPSHPHSPSSPKLHDQNDWQGQSPSTYIHSNGVRASRSNSESLTSRLSSLGPIGFASAPSIQHGKMGGIREAAPAPAPPPVYSDS